MIEYYARAGLRSVGASLKTVKHLLGPGAALDGGRHKFVYRSPASSAATGGGAVQSAIAVELQTSVGKRVFAVAAGERVDGC